ncbi:MAG: hypothetical protein R2942_06360 [Ignavibacteria bacterium]
MKILVVDDEKDVKTLFEQRFRKNKTGEDGSYLQFSTGEEA